MSHLGAGQSAWALKSKAAMLAAAVVRKLGPAAYTDLLPRLVAAAREGPLQAEVSLLVLQFVSEDLTQFEEAVGAGSASICFVLLSCRRFGGARACFSLVALVSVSRSRRSPRRPLTLCPSAPRQTMHHRHAQPHTKNTKHRR